MVQWRPSPSEDGFKGTGPEAPSFWGNPKTNLEIFCNDVAFQVLSSYSKKAKQMWGEKTLQGVGVGMLRVPGDPLLENNKFRNFVFVFILSIFWFYYPFLFFVIFQFACSISCFIFAKHVGARVFNKWDSQICKTNIFIKMLPYYFLYLLKYFFNK